MTTTTVRGNRGTGVWVVTIHDPLAFDRAARTAIDACLTQSPTVIIMDLREITDYSSAVMTALPAWQRRVQASDVALEYVVTDRVGQHVRRAPRQYYVKTHRTVARASAWALQRPRPRPPRHPM